MLTLDYETYSPLDIYSVGLARYAQQAEVMLCSYKVDHGPTQMWDATVDPQMPEELNYALRGDGQLLAFNYGFERTITEVCFGIKTEPDRWEDTMVLALTAGYPGKLSKLCAAYGLTEDEAKLSDGGKLINLFCKPAPKNHKIRRYTRHEKPEEWERFKEYCARDVDVTRLLWDELPHWTYNHERPVWALDQVINQRGLAFDADLARAAILLCNTETVRCDAEMTEVTGGSVKSVASTAALRAWASEQLGTEVKSLAKDKVDMYLNRALPPALRRALELRQYAGRSSVAKYEAGLRMQLEGRIYNSLQFYGAGRSGRWAGRGLQPHNMFRPDPEIKKHMETAVRAIKGGHAKFLYDRPLEVAASCARAMVSAAPRKKLIVADSANIEGRMLAALAGEEWKLQAFRDQDAGGTGVYELSYARSFGVDVANVIGGQRQIGKVQELALGYQGGPDAYVSMGANYGVDPQDVVEPVQAAVDNEKWDYWAKLYSPRRSRTLTLDQWTALSIIVAGWREAHPETVTYWADQERAAIASVQTPGEVVAVRGIGYLTTTHNSRDYLLCRLPSGRKLVYCHPELEMTTITYVDKETAEEKTFEKLALRYYGYQEHMWRRTYTYGGKLVENITQACARDVLAHGMQKAESAGYPVVLTVHDEIVCETDDTPRWNLAELIELMTDAPQWVHDLGMPMSAAGYEDSYYRKD